MLITEEALPPFSPSPPESTPLQWGDWEPFTLTPNSSAGNLQLNSTSAGVKIAKQQTQGSPLLGPKSMKNVVKVRLPNDQKTAVGLNSLFSPSGHSCHLGSAVWLMIFLLHVTLSISSPALGLVLFISSFRL